MKKTIGTIVVIVVAIVLAWFLIEYAKAQKHKESLPTPPAEGDKTWLLTWMREQNYPQWMIDWMAGR